MQERKLGAAGPSISAIGFGCLSMSDFYGPAVDVPSRELIHRALELGINFFDTSDMYGGGDNERLVGAALRDRRDRAIVATKFGLVFAPDGTFLRVDGSPAHIRQACDESLERLGFETIDLYYQHRIDPAVPIEDTVGAMAELVHAGKVRYLGLSEVAPATLRRAHAVHPIAALQTEYSLWSRAPEDELLRTCAELGVTFVAYSPLGRGFLTGAVRSMSELHPSDWRHSNPRFQGDNFQKNLELVEAIEALARQKSCTTAQLALAWLLARPEHVVPIPGTSKLARLEENARAAEIAITAAERAQLDAIVPKDAFAGSRYPAGKRFEDL